MSDRRGTLLTDLFGSIRKRSLCEVSRVKWKAGTSPASFPRIAIFVRTGTMRRLGPGTLGTGQDGLPGPWVHFAAGGRGGGKEGDLDGS